MELCWLNPTENAVDKGMRAVVMDRMGLKPYATYCWESGLRLGAALWRLGTGVILAGMISPARLLCLL